MAFKPIKIYADTAKGCLFFEGSQVEPKFLGIITASLASGHASRLLVVRNDRTDTNGNPRRVFKKLKAIRVKNQDGDLLMTDLGYSVAQVIDYINTEASKSPTDEIEASSFIEYDHFVSAGYTGSEETGGAVTPFKTIEAAIAAASDGDRIFLKGTFTITSEIVLPSDKSLYFFGTETTKVCYTSWNASNGILMNQSSSSCVKEFGFNNIIFQYSGSYALYIRSSLKTTIKNCTFLNNGWSGAGLSTTAADDGSTLGFDSDKADLAAFYAGAEASNGGAMRIRSTPVVDVTDNTVHTNLRGMRIQDCGIGGAGVIARNRCYNNIESGIYLAAGSYGSTAASGDGCENFSVYNNVSRFNANNGILIVGGINNIIGLNRVEGNWNAGVMLWNVSDTRARDMDLDNNNRSPYNGIGNDGDAFASINVAGPYLRADATYLAEIIDTTVQNTGLGRVSEARGFQISSSVPGAATGGLPSGRPRVSVDDCSFVNQAYGIYSEDNLDDLRFTVNDCRYAETTIRAVQLTGDTSGDTGSYYELPFSNHNIHLQEADFKVDNDSVIISEGVDGVRNNPYSIHDLKAELDSTVVQIMMQDSEKIQFNVELDGIYLNGVAATGTDSEKVNALNALLQGSGGGSGQAPVITSPLAISMTEGDVLNYELTADYGVAYEWSSLPTGVMTVDGNVRKLIGGSALTAGTYNIGVKALNYEGVDTETLVLTVTGSGTFSNDKAVWIQNGDFLSKASTTTIHPSLDRTTDAAGDGWTISMWIKPVSDSRGQTWFYYGTDNANGNGYIEIKQVNTNRLRVRYGKSANSRYIQFQSTGQVFTTGAWNHVVVSYDGTSTADSRSDRYDAFEVYVNGSEHKSSMAGSGGGYGGEIIGTRFRVGKYISGNQVRGGKADELALWDTPLSTTDMAALYNSGTPTDLTSDSPDSWYRFGDGANDSYPYIYDTMNGTDALKRLEMINATAANIVSDTP